MQKVLFDLKFAFRQLRNSLGFSVTAILMLAFGIGATTAIFSIVEGENEIRPTISRQNLVRAALSLETPPDAKKRCEDRSRLSRSPRTHAATVKTWLTSGASSPCSILSAIARNTNASTFVTASFFVAP